MWGWTDGQSDINRNFIGITIQLNTSHILFQNRIWNIVKVYRISVGKYPGKCPLGRLRRWIGNIDVGFRDIYCGNQGWVGLPQHHFRFSCHNVNHSDIYCFRKQTRQ